MAALNNLVVGLRVTMAEWMRLTRSDLQFAEAHIAVAVFIVMLALVVLVLLARQISSRKAGRTHPVPCRTKRPPASACLAITNLARVHLIDGKRFGETVTLFKETSISRRDAACRVFRAVASA